MITIKFAQICRRSSQSSATPVLSSAQKILFSGAAATFGGVVFSALSNSDPKDIKEAIESDKIKHHIYKHFGFR